MLPPENILSFLSQLRNRANTTDNEEDVKRTRSSLVFKLNMASKRDIFKKLDKMNVDNDTKLWKTVKPFFPTLTLRVIK